MQVLRKHHSQLFTLLGKTSGRDTDKFRRILEAGHGLEECFGFKVLDGEASLSAALLPLYVSLSLIPCDVFISDLTTAFWCALPTDAACVMELRAVSDFIPSGDHEVVVCEVVRYKNGSQRAGDGLAMSVPSPEPTPHPKGQASTSERQELATAGFSPSAFADVDAEAAEVLYTADLRREGFMQ